MLCEELGRQPENSLEPDLAVIETSTKEPTEVAARQCSEVTEVKAEIEGPKDVSVSPSVTAGQV